MKHKRSSRKRRRYEKRADRVPSVFAWISLTTAWLAVLPLCAFVFRPEPVLAQLNVPEAVAVYAGSEPVVPASVSEASAVMTVLPPVCSLRSDKPTILIYHTHTTEAYTQTETETYKESSKWRTFDESRNVVAVGEELKQILEVQYGFHVIHDTTDHEPPKLASAYERSVLTMERYHTEYPSIVLFIDLHRDAYDTTNAPCDYLTVNGTETARMMLVVGKGTKYEEKPYYDSNMALAGKITEHLNAIQPKLCRPIREKTGRYNQHVAPNCILVEVGHNANTLSQAKAAMPYLAESIVYAFCSQSVPKTDWTPN